MSKKRILAFILSLVTVVAVLPMFTISVSAASEATITAGSYVFEPTTGTIISLAYMNIAKELMANEK